MHALSKPHRKELHINLCAEMVLKDAELIFIISDKVVKERMGDSTIDLILDFPPFLLQRSNCCSSDIQNS